MTEQRKEVFLFQAPQSGYSRGYAILRVEASSEKEALKLIEDYEYEVVEYNIIRDDREILTDEAELMK